jgi:F0F1-type ATP synthase assembly protein I
MRRWVAALRLTGAGFFVGGSIVLGVVAGRWLDSVLNTKPTLVIVGLILGIVVAFYGVYRMILPNINKKQNKGKS